MNDQAETMGVRMKSTLCMMLVGVLFCAGTPVRAQPGQTGIREERPPTMKELLKWHEVLRYEVRYSFLKLGEVRVEILGDTLVNGTRLWHLKSIIRSNPGIPFVGREENHYHSLIVDTGALPKTLIYWQDDVDDDKYNELRYEFDYNTGNVYFFKDAEPADTLELESPGSSGQLILYYSRLFAGVDSDYKLPVYLDNKKGYIRMDNTTRIEEREVDAFPEPVKAYISEGNADFEGPFGFRGEFKGWYLDNALRVPIEAHVKVWLGNVKIRLIEYNKELRQ